MQYRMRYRDIPWGIAISVPIGKIIGCFILNPIDWVKKTVKNFLDKLRRQMVMYGLVTLLVIMLFLLIGILLNDATEGMFYQWIWHFAPSILPDPANMEILHEAKESVK